MSDSLANPTFDRWLRYVFDHPVREPAWYYDVDAEYYDPDNNPTQCVTYIGRLFADPVTHTQPYSDAQINQGLWMLIGEGQPELYTLFNPAVALDLRVQAVRAMFNVFRDLFAPRCSPRPIPEAEELESLNPVCYMWWDIIPLYGKSGDPERQQFDPHCLDVMEQTLKLDSTACQYAALHGLGHWKSAYPDRVEAVIDAYLPRVPNDFLREYALAARTGGIL